MPALILAAGLAPAVAAASTSSATAQWHKTFTAADYFASGDATAVSPNGGTVFATGAAAAEASSGDTGFAETIAYNAASGAVAWKVKSTLTPASTRTASPPSR